MVKIVLALIAFLALDAFAIQHALNNNDPKRRELAVEMAKLSTQALLVVFGAGVLVQEFNRRRDRKTSANAFRKGIYTSLVRAYTNTKKSRRILRARCCTLRPAESADTAGGVERGVRWNTYKAQLLSINDTQLELEVLLHEVRTFAKLFKKHDLLVESIANMENYLKGIIEEYEGASDIPAVAGCVPLLRLTALVDFLKSPEARGQQTEFRTHFGEPFRAAIGVLHAERLKV